MRPRIVDFLNHLCQVNLFDWLVPHPSTVYAFAMVVCLIVFVRRCGEAALFRQHALKSAIWAMLAGLIGARFFWILMNLGQVFENPTIIFKVAGGTASWGAYFFGVAGLLAYFVKQHESPLRYLDALGSLMGIGPFMGRWSCFLNGDDFGKLSSVSWAVSYPQDSIPFSYHVQQRWLSPIANTSLAVHPNQLYLSFNGLVLFLLFTFLWRHNRFAPGLLFCLYWATYTFNRFWLEFFRGGVSRDYPGGLSFSQVMALLVFTAAMIGVSRFSTIEKKLA